MDNQNAKSPTSASTETRKSPPRWHYTCRQCHQEFSLSAPSEPDEEKERFCPYCGVKDIQHKEVSDEAPPSGG